MIGNVNKINASFGLQTFEKAFDRVPQTERINIPNDLGIVVKHPAIEIFVLAKNGYIQNQREHIQAN